MVLPSEPSLKDAISDTVLTENVHVDDGDEKTVECSVLGASPAATVSWVIGQTSGEVQITGDSSITDRGDGLMDTVSRIGLMITSDEHHNKALTCEATIRIGSTVHTMTKSVTVLVHGPLEEITLSGADSLVDGNQTLLYCSVTKAFPKPKLIWELDGHDMTGIANPDEDQETPRGYYSVVSSLPLDVVRTYNGKSVMCSAVISGVRSGIVYNANASTIMNVHYCPLDISATCPVVQHGDSASVACGQVTSNPAAVVQIYEEGVAISQSRTTVNRSIVTSPVHGIETEVTFQRHFTKTQGPRNFQCCTIPSALCRNPVCQSCDANILHPPEVFPNAEGRVREVTEGDHVNLTCCAEANPAPHGLITWQSQGLLDVPCSPEGVLQSTKKTLTDQVCNVLTFSPVTARHAGEHVCLADNGLQPSYSAIFELRVHFPPCTSAGRSYILENEGSAASLRCDVIANPSADITWYYNGQPVNTSSPTHRIENSGSGGILFTRNIVELDIRGISSSSDAGNYTCIATNSVGTDSTIVELQVATIPDSPKNLQAPRNKIKEETLLVTWEPGYDGGKRQTFRLAYCSFNSKTPCREIANLQNASFKFDEDSLRPFTFYEIRIWSENEVGRSGKKSINVSTKRFGMTYSPSQGVVIMHVSDRSTATDGIPEDLCIHVEVNLGQNWTRTEECLDVGVVKTVQRDLLMGQLRGISCGRGLCSAPSEVVVQTTQGIPSTIIIIIASIGSIIILIMIILLCRYICKHKEKNDTKMTLSSLSSETKKSSSETRYPSSIYQPLSFPMVKTSLPPPLPKGRPEVKKNNVDGDSDDDNDYEDFVYAKPDQILDRQTYMYDDTSPDVCSSTKEDQNECDEGYTPMSSFTEQKTGRKPPKPLPKPTCSTSTSAATYDKIRVQIYENLRI